MVPEKRQNPGEPSHGSFSGAAATPAVSEMARPRAPKIEERRLAIRSKEKRAGNIVVVRWNLT
jgi:hypothetical protein